MARGHAYTLAHAREDSVARAYGRLEQDHHVRVVKLGCGRGQGTVRGCAGWWGRRYLLGYEHEYWEVDDDDCGHTQARVRGCLAAADAAHERWMATIHDARGQDLVLRARVPRPARVRGQGRARDGVACLSRGPMEGPEAWDVCEELMAGVLDAHVALAVHLAVLLHSLPAALCGGKKKK